MEILAGGYGDMSNAPGGPNERLTAKETDQLRRNLLRESSVEGDSLKNDKIPAMLSEGEGVIDRGP